MVLSLKANRKRIAAAVILILLVIVSVSILPKITEKTQQFEGGTHSERVQFLKSFGYEVASDPVDVRTVTIPKEFSDIYKEYNNMQKAQGFDLVPYRGKECKQYVYLITNYQGANCEIYATMLVYQNIIIGGDVSSAELNGFMHGFSRDSSHFGLESENKATAEKDGLELGEKETAVINQGENEDIYPTD